MQDTLVGALCVLVLGRAHGRAAIQLFYLSLGVGLKDRCMTTIVAQQALSVHLLVAIAQAGGVSLLCLLLCFYATYSGTGSLSDSAYVLMTHGQRRDSNSLKSACRYGV
eukprot:970986-Pleurochrysis_carterae.AAC.2